MKRFKRKVLPPILPFFHGWRRLAVRSTPGPGSSDRCQRQAKFQGRYCRDLSDFQQAAEKGLQPCHFGLAQVEPERSVVAAQFFLVEEPLARPHSQTHSR